MPKGKTNKNAAAFKQAYESGSTLRDAKLAAGYSLKSANVGRQEMPQELLDIVDNHDRLKAAAARGAQITQQVASDAIKDTMATILLDGEKETDKIAAAQVLGKHKDVAAFVQEQQTGIILIQPPNDLISRRILERLAGAPKSLPVENSSVDVLEAQSIVVTEE